MQPSPGAASATPCFHRCLFNSSPLQRRNGLWRCLCRKDNRRLSRYPDCVTNSSSSPSERLRSADRKVCSFPVSLIFLLCPATNALQKRTDWAAPPLGASWERESPRSARRWCTICLTPTATERWTSLSLRRWSEVWNGRLLIVRCFLSPHSPLRNLIRSEDEISVQRLQNKWWRRNG